MSLKVIQIEFPKIRYSSEYDAAKFDEYDLRAFRPDTEKLVYYYGTGSYCGSGQALYYWHGNWYHADLGHCSCYGPTENVDYTNPISSLSAWLEQSTPEFHAEVQPLIDAIQNEK